MKYIQSLSALFKIPKTYMYMFMTAISMYILTIVLSHGKNVWNILFLDIPFISKISAVISFFTSPFDTFSKHSFIILVLTSCVVGLQLALVYLYAKNKLYLKDAKLSLAGIIAALMGCFACCGSVVFSLMSSIIGVSIQSFLPFGGIEFSYIGLCVASLGFFVTLHTYHRPQIC